MNTHRIVEDRRTIGRHRGRGHAVAPSAGGTLAFRVPAQQACRVRQAVSAAPRCTVRRCVPHPSEEEVALWIDFEAGMQDALMDVLMACVPCGQFGRITRPAPVLH